MTYRQLLNRLIWTAVASVGGGLSAPVVFDFAVWKGLASGAMVSVVNVLTLFARQKLAEGEPPVAP